MIYEFRDSNGDDMTINRDVSGNGFVVQLENSGGEVITVEMSEDDMFGMLNSLIGAIG